MDAEEREDPEGERELEAEAPHRAFDQEEFESRPVRSRTVRRPKKRRSTAWIAFILLLASIYVFWVLPYQLGSHPVRVEFTQDKK
jgi:hypothetical protein